MRRIETLDDLAEGIAALAVVEPRFSAAPTPPLRRNPGGFGGLLRIVMGQQVSVASADAIWGRLVAAGADTAEGVRRLDDAALRACGLSGQKLRYARALVAADLDFAALEREAEEEAVARLTAVTGVGRWTAEIYLMFCVGRADVFAPGDLALQEGARMMFALPERPAPRALALMAEAWSPWRAVAARLLWSYYGAAKRREGVIG